MTEHAAVFINDVKQSVYSLSKSVEDFDKRFAIRCIRNIPSLRRNWSADLLADVVKIHVSDIAMQKILLASLAKTTVSNIDISKSFQDTSALPESCIYVSLLVLIFLIDQKQYEAGLQLANGIVNCIVGLNRRTMDVLASTVYFYFARFYELTGKLSECRPLVLIRFKIGLCRVLLRAQRIAALRRDNGSLATLINLLLRNYLEYDLYDQAEKLVSKSQFPEHADNNQWARYLFYTGRIKAIHLDYTAAYADLTLAIRKAPQTKQASGFLQVANKFAVLVQLLMGEIPDRSIFRQAVLASSLLPYFHLTQSVRVGDLAKFQDTLARYGSVFKSDHTYTLILRLRHTVIKAGIRMISKSYSRISLKDICVKLHLDSEEDAEYIVTKSIRDGVIDAFINHEHAWMKSKENIDIYATGDPQDAYHHRVKYCLSLHNESVKALRFPDILSKEELDTAKEIRDREREISDMVEDLSEDDDGMDF